MAENSNDSDLPLMSNIDEVRIVHYVFTLMPNFSDKTFTSSVYLILDQPQDICSKLQPEGTDSKKDLNEDNFKVILDCKDLSIINCFEINVPLTYIEYSLSYKNENIVKELSIYPRSNLKYEVKNWCLEIFGIGNPRLWNSKKVIQITYKTKSHGASLTWTNDDSQNPCVYTTGSAINNRSMLPGQDRPKAMATWQAYVFTDQMCYVAMTGDKSVKNINLKLSDIYFLTEQDEMHKHKTFLDNLKCSYYFTEIILPIATLAIAIGQWTLYPSVRDYNLIDKNNYPTSPCQHENYECYMQSEDYGPIIQSEIVSSPRHYKDIILLAEYIPSILSAARFVLGRHPLKRLQIVILPHTFASFGLASPHLLFLSPSCLLNDSSSHIRICHEISHTWFGIILGALDWTEEWLSEGFATFVEDIIYSKSMEYFCQYKNTRDTSNQDSSLVENMCVDTNSAHSISVKNDLESNKWNFIEDYKYKRSHVELEELSYLRALIRYRTLAAEVDCSSENLQILSLNNREENKNSEYVIDTELKGENAHSITYKENCVKEGLNPEKTFLQVHYLKGYFLLRHLCVLSGREKFSIVLQKYVSKYHGLLVTSNEFLDLFFEECPLLIEKKTFCFEWLSHSGIPEKLKCEFDDFQKTGILRSIWDHFHYWDEINTNYLKQEKLHKFPPTTHKFDNKVHNLKTKKLKLTNSNEILVNSSLMSKEIHPSNKPNKSPFLNHAKYPIHKNHNLISFKFSDQLVMLLELLLDLEFISHDILYHIKELYHIQTQSADVRHRWCELIIKNKMTDKLNEVSEFLLYERAMGVYLYGELAIAGENKYLKVARDTYNIAKTHMDNDTKKVVTDMLYPT